LRQPLVILATADEESSMSGARALAAAGQPLGRHAVIGEPTGLETGADAQGHFDGSDPAGRPLRVIPVIRRWG
jgi:acetylornithine deacetylase/succinyl-diaminopimelate desuccinylase-like protein